MKIGRTKASEVTDYDLMELEPAHALEPASEEPEDFEGDTTAIQNGEDEGPDGEGEERETPPPSKKKLETSKLIVILCLLNGFAWVWCSYILAWFGRTQIAESLSQVALTEIIAVVLTYSAKALFEQLSKHNDWPDKPNRERK